MSYSNYRSGFIDSCVRHGLSEKTASCLCKQAGPLGFLKNLSVLKGIRGWGRFSAKHPYLGLTAAVVPTALIASSHTQDNANMMEVNTMTPGMKSLYDQTFHGYPGLGLDYDDISKIRFL